MKDNIDNKQVGPHPKKSMSRRVFLKMSVAGALATGISGTFLESCGNNNEIPSLDSFPKLPAGPVTIDLSVLKDKDHKNVNPKSLFSQFMGNARAYEEHTFDPAEHLGALWRKKIAIAGLERKVNQEKMYTEIIEPYVTNEMPRHSIRLKEYEEVINSCLHVLRKSIDVHTIQITKTRMLTENEKKVITEILEKIDGKSLISYAMTEISDMKGAFNVKYFDLLLRQCGIEYLDYLPAFHDSYLSFGPYQFTSFAVNGMNDDELGVAKLNALLPKEVQIPGSVKYLKRSDHHIAATLFIITNIINGIKHLNAEQTKQFARVVHKNRSYVLQYCACAHHNPTLAKKSLHARANNNFKGKFYNYAKKYGEIGDYCEKTSENYKAL